MSEDKVYKDGDIVWVKLGNSWWPGEVIGDENRMPDDVQQFKKQPYCVVKFFQEDAYEYPKSAKLVYPFQCSKKNEFIKKGLALFNAKKAFMEKFPDDVKHAESRTKSLTMNSDRSGGFVTDMWRHGNAQRSTELYDNSRISGGGGSSNNAKSQLNTTPRRDSVTTILNITLTPSSTSATSARTLSTSSSASVTQNTIASNQYRCNMCDFTTMRQNVLIMHRKSHSNSGSGAIPSTRQQSSNNTLNSSSIRNERLNISIETINETLPKTTKTATTKSTKDEIGKQHVEKINDAVKKEDNIKSISSVKSRKKTTTTRSPSPRVSTTKRTLRVSRTEPHFVSPTTNESSSTKDTMKKSDAIEVDKNISDCAESSKSTKLVDGNQTEKIRQRLLADWSDEEKDENHHTIHDPTTSNSRRNKATSHTLQLPSNNVRTAVKRRSPTIVPMKTLEGAGQTLVVAAATTQSNIIQDATAPKTTTQRIRNIPKKDRLRDFGNRLVIDVQPNMESDEVNAKPISAPVESTEKPTNIDDTLNDTEDESAVSGALTAASSTLSCFDFQEDEEENENDVLKSIANYKKKYFSPDKDKGTSQTAPNNNEANQGRKTSIVEQRDNELSAEIDSLLEQTTVAQALKEEIILPASVKGLPIKERGKRIFKSRNRAPVDDESDAVPAMEVTATNIKSLDELDAGVENLNAEPVGSNSTATATSPSISGRKTRSKNSRTPVNGNSNNKNKIKDNSNMVTAVDTETVQSGAEMVYVSQRSRRKPYNHRIMRQLIEDEESSIPFIRHSPVEIYSCDSSMDNGATHVLRGRRSKTTTPSSLTTGKEETVNGGGDGGSPASSRNMNTGPLTPTDETSSLGVSDAGAEFGSPASSLDEERLLTPVYDVDSQKSNEFKPISEKRKPNVDNDVEDTTKIKKNIEEDDEIESPPHEALSGNELEAHQNEKDRKRTKSPKKKFLTKEHQQQQQQQKKQRDLESKIAQKRKSPATTTSPNSNELPKRLTRGALQHQELEANVSLRSTRSTRGSPAVIEQVEQKTKERRSVSTKLTISGHKASKEEASELLTFESKTSNLQKKNVPVEKVDSSNTSLASVSTEESSTNIKGTTKLATPQRKLKRQSISKTPVTDAEASKNPTEVERIENVKQKLEENNEEVLKNQKSPKEEKNSSRISLQDAGQSKGAAKAEKTESVRKDTASPLWRKRSLSKDVEQKQISPEKPSITLTRDGSPVKISSPKHSPHSSNKKYMRNESPKSKGHITDNLEKQSIHSKSPKRSTDNHSTSNKTDKKSPIADSTHSIKKPVDADNNSKCTNSPRCDDKISSTSVATSSLTEQVKKLSRWDSPHSAEKTPTLIASDKKHNAEKKLNRDSHHHTHTDKKQSSADASHDSAKKSSRWDSPLLAERKKKTEEPNSGTKLPTQDLKAAELNSKEIKEKDSLPKKEISNSKSQMRKSSSTSEVVENVVIKSTDNSSAILPTKEIEKTQKSSTVTSPTIEKVRINVDVANPLSTQIANILAASGNNINNQQQQQQQQLQLANRNKSQKSNTSSPLKRKHSLAETSIVCSDSTDADGDAVVAHVQSLCPQVKITRKERIIGPIVEPLTTPKKMSTTPNTAGGLYDINQMPIVISSDRIATPKKSPRTSNTNVSALCVSNLWQTDILQAPQMTISTSDTRNLNELEPHGIISSSSQQPNKLNLSPTQTTSSERNRLSPPSRSLQSASPHKSPAASTGGRKQAGNTVTLPSSITVKQHQHKFAEALALADSILETSSKPTKRRSSQTNPASTFGAGNTTANRRLNSAPALDVRSSPPVKIPKIATEAEQTQSGPFTKENTESNSTGGKSWCQSHRQAQKPNKIDSPVENMVVDPIVETTTVPATSPSSTKPINTEDSQNVSDVEQLNSTAKITAVPIQPIPGYAETFLLCMLVDNMYKPINNIPHYLNTDLNQLVPVPPEAYEGMLPELAVDQPPAQPTDQETSTESSSLLGSIAGQQQQQHQQMKISNEHEQCSRGDKSEPLMTTSDLGESGTCNSGGNVSTEAALGIDMQQPGVTALSDNVNVEPDPTESATDNAIVLNLENQQIILDAATFEQLLANPDANTQLVTDDGTEFVLTREVLTALKAQHDGQNVEMMAISSEQQQQQHLPEQLIVSDGISEAGPSADLLSVALANSEYYGNDVLQIETTLGTGAAGLQLLAGDGSIVFQAPPLPQAHLTPPITAHTSETNAVLNQTPIMSTLEKPSTAVVSGSKIGVESGVAGAVVSGECDISGIRPNLDDSLAVIGVTTQSSTVPTSLELPITITNPAIAPKVTMAQTADLVQFQPHRSVATVATVIAPTSVPHIYEGMTDDIN